MNAPLPEEKVEALAEAFRSVAWLEREPGAMPEEAEWAAFEVDTIRALAPLVAGWLAEADNEARLSEMQGKADSLTGVLIVEAAKAEERERIAQGIEAAAVTAHQSFAADEAETLAEVNEHLGTDMQPTHWHRHDDGCSMCGLARAARIARGTA